MAFLAALATLVALLPAASTSSPGPIRPTGTPVPGLIVGDVTWDVSGSPYIVSQDVTVDANASLTILAGVEVRFEGVWTFMSLGSLVVRGEAGNPVQFRQNQTGATSQFGIRGDGRFTSESSMVIDHAFLADGHIGFQGPGRFAVDGLEILCTSSMCGDALGLYSVRSASIRRATVLYSPGQAGADHAVSAYRAPGLVVDSFLVRNTIGFALGPGCDGCMITNGTVDRIDPPSEVTGILLQGNDSLISNIHIPIGASNFQIKVEGDRNVIRGNRLESAGQDAIGVAGNDVLVEANVIDRPAWGGVDVHPLAFGTTIGTVVRNNRISYAGFAGISLSSGGWPAYGTTVLGNLVDNSARGVVIEHTQSTVRGNTFQSNGVGVELRGSSNQVDHNHFEFNTVQARDTVVGNAWDDGYPSGGNWWSDYVGNDLYNGPLQDVPGPDGIGDTPYVINAFSQDHYPFYSQPAPGIPGELTAQFFRGTGTVALTWQAAPMADSYYVYTANTPTGFDFSAPIRLGNVTSWVDGAAGARYYVVRGHNTALGRTSATSNTAGAWTRMFPAGVSTFSFPFAPYPWVDYGAPGWLDTAGKFLAGTGATSLAYMEAGRWRSVPGDGDSNRTLAPGEGYLVAFPAAIPFTFTGVPGAQIDYAEWPPYALKGFDPATTAREVTATAVGDDVVLTWAQLPEIPVGNGTYEVYASRTPAGLRGYPGVDYTLLATVLATGAPTLAFTHVGALATSPAWYYFVVPVLPVYRRGASSYSVGVVAVPLDSGYSAIGLPLRPYANGTYLTARVSSLLGVGVTGVQWFDLVRQDWVAHAAWMPSGIHDTDFVMIMAVQVDATSPTRIVFVGA